jgi:hypothetical protein
MGTRPGLTERPRPLKTMMPIRIDAGGALPNIDRRVA